MTPRTHPMRERFLFSIEEECLTALPDEPDQTIVAIERFLSITRRLAPSLRGPSGHFNGYGRTYADMGHIEHAAMECDDPFLLAEVVEKQHAISAQAVVEMEKEGSRIVLANNNHSGLLRESCPVWGTHENYLVEEHPSEFTDLILPFLVTRIFAGAGGIHFPTGNYLAGVRPTRMERATGGDTTDCRAIHSTAREEHHMGAESNCFRYHQILGDGHRSHFNLALQIGTTAIALKAVLYDPNLRSEIAKLRRFPLSENHWVKLLQEINILAKPGQPLSIDPLVVATQRVYLAASRRFVATMGTVAPWIPRVLDDWSSTLDAMDRLDRTWLAARLDSFAKYEFYSNVLNEAGSSWEGLPKSMKLFQRLALLDHDYHEFCNPSSIFCQLEKAGALDHRVGHIAEPGTESEPYVPDTTTRARARARLITSDCDKSQWIVDWSSVHDIGNNRRRDLNDPFATSYGPWSDSDSPSLSRESVLARMRQMALW